MKRRHFLHQAAAAGSALVLGDAVPARPQSAPARADLVLRRARIYDGTGSAAFTGDVAIAAGRITEVAARIGTRGSEELDLNGLALSPGFIDIHSHTTTNLMAESPAQSKVRQGVTTEVSGQDGSSPVDVAAFLRDVDTRGGLVNAASMVGAGSLRGDVVGSDDRPATPAEIARMIALVRAALDGGACGVSSGLEYTPGGFADATELEALATPLRGTGLAFASHMRNEDDRVLGSVEEILGIGQRAGVGAHISHLKAQGERNWWKTDSIFHVIEGARAAGVDATFDVYPYIAYSTGITNLFPLWSRDGGTDAFLARLDDSAHAARIEAAVRAKIASLGTWDAVQFTSSGAPEFAWIVGKRLGRLAQERASEPYALLLEIVRGTRARPGMVGFGMSEENVAKKLAHPLAMVCSDAGAVSPGSGAPHPRAYGAFPRVLGKYVRDMKVLSLASAIHKMTMRPAQRLRFDDRGRIAVNMAADLVVFDPDTVSDRATFEDPHQYAAGIPHVIVNGAFVLRAGEVLAVKPGRAVRPAR
ncbi:MAG TPA: D-aminoacylase [Longimicrobiales bacterium]|nr:D-aminoacylase [Longimicrobiales bacterium]